MHRHNISTIQSVAAELTRELKKKPRGRPRKIVPSQRDQEIFQRVAVDCQRQEEVAAELGVTRSRVSQIKNRVGRWLAGGGQADEELMSALERRRLERKLAQTRQESIYQRLIRTADRLEANSKQTTVRTEVKGSRFKVQGSKLEKGNAQSTLNRPTAPVPEPGTLNSTDDDGEITKVVTTVRDGAFAAAHVQLIKAAQRSAIELERLAEREPLPEPSTPTDDELFTAICDILCEFRQRAERAGRVSRSKDVAEFIEHILATVLGGKFGYPIADDPAVQEMIRSLAGDRGQESADREQEPGVRGQEANSTEYSVPGTPHESPAGSPTHHSPAHRSPSANFAHSDSVALDEEPVPRPGGEEPPSPPLFVSSDERLLPVPTEGAAQPAAQKTECVSENQIEPREQRTGDGGRLQATHPAPCPLVSVSPCPPPAPAPMPPGSYMFGGIRPIEPDPRIAAAFDPWARPY